MFAEEYEYPIAHCPKCGKGQPDMDGFGFIACLQPDGCGHCKHVAASKADDSHWYCDICGDRLTRKE